MGTKVCENPNVLIPLCVPSQNVYEVYANLSIYTALRVYSSVLGVAVSPLYFYDSKGSLPCEEEADRV